MPRGRQHLLILAGPVAKSAGEHDAVQGEAELHGNAAQAEARAPPRSHRPGASRGRHRNRPRLAHHAANAERARLSVSLRQPQGGWGRPASGRPQFSSRQTWRDSVNALGAAKSAAPTTRTLSANGKAPRVLLSAAAVELTIGRTWSPSDGDRPIAHGDFFECERIFTDFARIIPLPSGSFSTVYLSDSGSPVPNCSSFPSRNQNDHPLCR
jgi:hypothetical protein